MANVFMTEHEAAVALVSFHLGKGPLNGSFATNLIHAFTSADAMNRMRLLRGFPEFAHPLNLLESERIEDLESKIDSGYFAKI